MAPLSPNGESLDGSYEVLWQDGERIFRRGWRLDDNGNRLTVLIVLPAADHPSRSSLDRLTHEYELKDQLDGSWALRPLDLLHDAGRSALVLEDAAGEPLERLLGAPMEVGRFLRLAIAIASTADAGADRYSKVNLLRLARSLCGRRIRGPGGSKATAGTDLEPYSRRCPPADH
jgi:hypothetical protein